MSVAYPFVFNFAVSHTGGGRKRLVEYARWFDEQGGAFFIVNARIEEALRTSFPRNRYFPVNQPLYERVFADCKYLGDVEEQVGTPELYYSFGIPVYRRFGRVNWFHLSNVLPIHHRGKIPLAFLDRLKASYLGGRMRAHYGNADVISSESSWALGLIEVPEREKLFLSVNGSDDEIHYLRSPTTPNRTDTAMIVGTYRYKALGDSYRVFSMLRESNPTLRLTIAGDTRHIPRELGSTDAVLPLGVIDRSEVIERLRVARYYISTTLIESGYNAASEGAGLAQESYLSDIGPHRELLDGVRFRRVSVPGVARPLLHVMGQDLSTARLKSWNEVITDMLAKLATV